MKREDFKEINKKEYIETCKKLSGIICFENWISICCGKCPFSKYNSTIEDYSCNMLCQDNIEAERKSEEFLKMCEL